MGRAKSRGNGQGTAYKRGNTWMGEVRQSRPPFRMRKGGFATKTEALKWVASVDIVAEMSRRKNKREAPATFREVYDLWLPTHQRSKQTLDCYRSAFKHFSDIHDVPFRDIEIEDLQECLDSCSAGRRTKENMRALASLMYKYAIPRRDMTRDALNLAAYVRIYDASTAGDRVGIPVDDLPKIKAAIGSVPYAEHILALCLTGFRVSAFLSLRVEDYDRKNGAIVGGIKTAAGRDRTVTLPPDVKPIFDAAAGDRAEGPLFADENGDSIQYSYFREKGFYPALDAIGIENPVTVVNGVEYHRYTPHSCRHTYATLLKNATGSDKDKQALIGHTSPEMLRYYQDVDIDSLKAITDQIKI